MNDAEYLYRQDVKEKAIIARSSRKRGSARRRKCQMSTDSMTRKEWEKMNGPVSTVQLNAPISWEAFCELPKNMQQEYVKHILTRYAVGPYALAQMFGISGTYCSTYLHSLGITFTKRASQKETARFLADYGMGAGANTPAPVADKKCMQLDRISLTFSGAFSSELIAARLKGLFPDEQQVVVTIEVSAAK